MGKELLYMCRLIISLRAKIPEVVMKKSAKIYVINVRMSFGGKIRELQIWIVSRAGAANRDTHW
jgi:hypothetical protein